MLGVALILMTYFNSVGFATITDTLRVTGKASVDMPSGLFITNIKTSGTNRIDVNNVSFPEYTTTVNSTVSKDSNSSAGKVTYMITVLNNTKYEYAYRGLYYINSYENNSYVSTSNGNNSLGVVTSISQGTIIKPGEQLTFTVTYTIGKNIDKSKSLTTSLNYQFGINVDSIDKAADIVHQKFLEILNTETTYQQLIEVLDDKFDGYQTWTSNYIGNVGNAVNNDMMTVETLFAGQLTMMVNGKAQKAWVMIKHEDLDGNELTGDDYDLVYNQYGLITHKGCEMTLYMTIDELQNPNSWAPVYVTVFTCDRDEQGNFISDWYKVGDTYYGEANVVGYRGESGGTGSFVTDNWRSLSATYQVTDQYTYSVGQHESLKTLMQTTDANAIREFQRLLEEAEAMIANINYAGTGIAVVELAYYNASAFYTLDAQGKAIAKSNTRRVWLIPIMNELDYVLSVAREAIDKIEQEQQ